MFYLSLINNSAFNFNNFDRDFKIPEIRIKFQEFVKEYAENYEEYDRAQQPWYHKTVSGIVHVLAGDEEFNEQVKNVVNQHAQVNARFTEKINELQDRWSKYMVAPGDLPANHTAFTREYYEVHEKFLEEQLSFIDFYLKTLNRMEKGKLVYEFQKGEFNVLKNEIEVVQSQLQGINANLKQQKKSFLQQLAKPKEEVVEAYKQLYDLVVLLSFIPCNCD